jgi:hypothetical protein
MLFSYVRNNTLYRYELPSGPEVSRSFSSEDFNNGNTDLIFDEVTQKLYWIRKNPFQVRSIPADFTGTTPISTVVGVNNGSDGGFTPTGARGLSIDGINGKLYIGETSAPPSFASVRLELVSYDISNGTRSVLHSFTRTSTDISSTIVDAPNNRVYWAETNTEIGYVDLNGNSPQILLSIPGSQLFTIRKDPTANRIIFTAANS